MTAPRPAPTVPVRLLVILVVSMLIGAVGTTASVVTARGQSTASRADVLRNREVVEAVRRLQLMSEAEAEAFRTDLAEAVAALCRLIEEVADRAEVPITQRCSSFRAP